MPWPSIPEPATINGRYIKKQHKTTYETGRPVSVAADNQGHYEYTLRWPDLSQSYLDLLIAAFENDQGATFTWKHFYNQTWYYVNYAEDSLQFEQTEEFVTGHYSVEVKLETVTLSTTPTTTTTTTTTA